MGEAVKSPWRKSRHSNINTSQCVEVAAVADGAVLVRDTANRDGGMLKFSVSAWSSFMASL